MTPENLVREQLEAYNARDLERFCACYHAEVKMTRLLTGDVGVSGMARFREVYRGLFDASPMLHCELKHRIVLSEAIIDEEWVTGAARYPQGLHAAVIYAFRDGLIDRVWSARS